MPLSPTGQYTLPNGYLAVTGQDVLPSNHNPPLEDIAAVLSEAFYRTGVAPMLAQLNMNTFKVTNVANGTASGDAINKSQLDQVVTFPNNETALFNLGDVMIQFASSVINTDVTGQGLVTFPIAFSAVPGSIIACSGSSAAYAGAIAINAAWNAFNFGISTNGLAPSTVLRINWVAIGQRT